MERQQSAMSLRIATAAAGVLLTLGTAPVALADPPADPLPAPVPGAAEVVPVANPVPPAPPVDTGAVASEVPGIAKTLDGRASVAQSGTLDAAVVQAYADAAADAGSKGAGDAIVLLSPACASFDQYPDFEARGEAFRAAVQRLAHAQQGAA